MCKDFPVTKHKRSHCLHNVQRLSCDKTQSHCLHRLPRQGPVSPKISFHDSNSCQLLVAPVVKLL